MVKEIILNKEIQELELKLGKQSLKIKQLEKQLKYAQDYKKLKEIPVGSATTLIFQHSVAKWIAGKYPAKTSHLKEVLTMLLGSKEFRENAENNLGKKNFQLALKYYNKYSKYYALAEYFEDKIIQFKGDGTIRASTITKYFEKHQQEMMGKLPVVDEAILRLFFALTRQTVLENQQLPKEVINAKKEVNSLNLEGNRYGV